MEPVEQGLSSNFIELMSPMMQKFSRKPLLVLPLFTFGTGFIIMDRFCAHLTETVLQDELRINGCNR